jgi:hypothetical protein
MFDISREAENLMVALGYDPQGWGYVVDDFQEINFELEANGVPTYGSLEEFLRRKLEWKQSLRTDVVVERIAA